nr:hypothetical protein [Mycolicibacterium gilvum]
MRQAATFLGEDKPSPKRVYLVIDRLVDAGAPVDRCCVIPGVTRQNYYKH